MPATIGALTTGGNSPGLNAAIRAVGKAAQRAHDLEVLGVPLKKIAGQTKGVPIDHPRIDTARHLGVTLGD